MQDLAVATTSSNEETSTAPQRSLDRQVVLEEDEYTEALSHIIARDFFPSLVHLDATNSYLDALRSHNPQLIDASVRQLQELATPLTNSDERYRSYQTPSQTPWAAAPCDTPLRTPLIGSEPPQKRKRYDTDMSLDEFQARYTSEDNASFTQILDEENQRRKDRYGWAWDAQRRVEEQRVKMIEGRKNLVIERGSVPGVKEKLVIEPPQPPAGFLKAAEESEKGDEGKDEGEDEVMDESKALVLAFEEQGEKVDVMAKKKDTRSAGVDGWKFRNRNALMFPPDADASPHVAGHAPTGNSKGEPKTIKYDNTRLPEQNETSSGMSEPPSPTRSRIDAAIAGTPYQPRSLTNNGFSLLPTMPSPTPSELGPAAVKQLMTWGTLNATPRIISSDDPADMIKPEESDLPPPNTPFHLPPPSSREKLGQRLSNNASRSLRTKAAMMKGGGASSGLGFRTPGISARGSMPPPSWTPSAGVTPKKSEAAGALTPAARRLLDRTTSGTVAGARRAEAMGRTANWEGKSASKEKAKDLSNVRWTPSPAVKRG